MNPVHENIPNGLNKSGNSEISYGFQTATDIGNSLDKLPWDILLWRQDLDLYSRLLNANHWNLIHLASEYGYVEIVKVLISKSTGAVPGNMSQLLLRSDVYHQMTPLHYAAMKGNMQVLQLLLDAVTTSGTYLLMETPRPSDDIPAEVFEALNTKLLSAVKTTSQSWWKEHSLLEKFLASDPLLFRALSSRSCPMQTQYYCCLLTRQTDDLLDEMQKSRDEVGPDEGPDRVNIYPMHWVITTKFFHIAKLLLIYESGSSSLCLLKDMQGDTPLHCAAQRGEVSFIDILLSTCWECAGVVSDNKNETALHCAFRNNQAKAFKTLLGWYIIKEEILNNNAGDWECEDTSLDLLVDGYVNIVKELLCQSESKVCFQREFWEGKDYFVVIKCKSKESIGTSFKYQDYIREVSSKTTNRIILSLSVDSRSIITLKVLIRSVMVRGILDVKDVYRYTVLDLLDMWPEPEDMRKKTNLMGFVLYERYENVIWLLDAIQMGDYEAFSKLQVEDPQILDHVCEFPLGGTPLHIAVRVGQLNDCTREIIRKRPEFAATKDNKGRIPLHIASAKGYLEIVKELLTQLGFNQCFSSAHLVYKQDFYIDGEFYGTPIEYAIEKGRISVINELLSVWWKCVRVVNREANSELLKIAVACKQLEAMKMLMERYIEDELLKAKEVDGNPMSALADGYIEIVLKHLLSPKVNYSLSILMKNRMGKYPPLPLYFAVIKVTSRSRRKENNIIDELQLSAYYPKYFREVTVRNKMVLHLSVDNGNSVTLKLLLRSPLFYEIDDLFGATIFQRLWDKLEIKVRISYDSFSICVHPSKKDFLLLQVVENEMGTLLPIW
ncbi:hypothetical protein MKW92_009880 [Papaver armeniacum]|nr:hypothetical protein MKW92_009880 [Papaver armeniacum]